MTEYKDPTPLGYETIREAFQKFREAKRGKNVDDHPPRNSVKWRKWYAPYSKSLDEDVEEFEAALRQGALEVIVTLPRDGREYRITPHEISTAFWPGRMALSDTIDDLANGPLGKYRGRTPHVSSGALLSWLAGLNLRYGSDCGAVTKRRTVSPASAIAKRAMLSLWPDGVPETIQAKERDHQIDVWCKSQRPRLTTPSPKTIRSVVNSLEKR